MQFTADEFVQFFTEKKKGVYTCSFCGSTNFNIDLGGAGAETLPAELQIPVLRPPGLTAPASHNFFAISCINCGKTDFFHVLQVEAWKKSKGIA